MHPSGSDEQGAVDYDLLERQVASLLEDERDFIANAANFAAFLYTSLPVVNWAGFYFPDEQGLVLGPFGGKPACTRLPKGKGVCNRAFEGGISVIVDDVNAFADHIACDSASRSEMVVPLLAGDSVFGVFDIDSPVTSRFTEADKAGVERLVDRFMQLTPVPERYKTRRKTLRINDRIDVQTCRDHHVVLRYLIEDLDKPETRPEDALGLLARVRNVLIAHLKLEDDWLYPRLATSENAIVRGKAERYRSEMGGLRERFDALWKRWSKAGAISGDPDAFRAEWHTLRQALIARIETEDDDLYVAAETDLT